MSYKAYLITFSVGTRVVSSKDLNQEKNYDELWKLVGPRIHANLESSRIDNLDEINEDEECPFNPLTDREWMDDYVRFDEEAKPVIGQGFTDLKMLFGGQFYRLRYAYIASVLSLFKNYSDIRHEIMEEVDSETYVKIYQGLTMGFTDRFIAAIRIVNSEKNTIRSEINFV